MVAIVAVANGVTVEDQSNYNQYRDTLNAVLGLTDTVQDALGRLVLPRSAAPPGSPSEAQVYYDTDDDTPYYRNGAGVWVPMRGIRQSTSAALVSNVALGTTETSILSAGLTTSGGLILVLAYAQYSGLKDGGTNTASVFSVLKRDTTALQRQDKTVYHAASTTWGGGFSYFYYEIPAAGSYTWSLAGYHGPSGGSWTNMNAIGSGTESIPRCRIQVLELTGP